MTAKTIPQIKALHASGQNIFRRQSADVLLARISELEAENEILKKDVASESGWAEHYHKRADEFEALLAANREEIDRLCALLGQADAKLTDPPQAGWKPEQFDEWRAA